MSSPVQNPDDEILANIPGWPKNAKPISIEDSVVLIELMERWASGSKKTLSELAAEVKSDVEQIKAISEEGVPPPKPTPYRL